jgi:hypothetical protein
LLKTQRPDGGFDIGYDFNFGRQHKRGESTSPELVGLVALAEYCRHFGGEEAKAGAHRAAAWIRKHVVRQSEERWAIPYGPYSTKEIMVYNGTSFAVGALGVYLSLFPNGELKEVYHGMNRYLYDVMTSVPGAPGRFWYYSDQSRNDLTLLQREKIDYYHQMQQVEMHAMAELKLHSSIQPELIEGASEHVAWKQDDAGLIPYTNRKEHFGGDLHLWGLCSCAAGFLMAGKVLSAQSAVYRARAERIYAWMYRTAWNGRYFFPIVSPSGAATDARYYVRSDAWVFNAFSLAVLEGIEKDKYIGVCEKCFLRMARKGFSGIENHATCTRTKIVRAGLGALRQFARRRAV